MFCMIISGVQIDDHSACVTWDQVLRYHEALNTVRKLSWTQMVNVTGCLAKCSYREFRFEKVGITLLDHQQHELNLQQHFIQISEEAVYWKTLSSSSFFLYAKRTMVKIEEELLVFDFEDLVNGLGGALGLFLGWSLLQILLQSFTFFHQIIRWATKKCNTKSV